MVINLNDLNKKSYITKEKLLTYITDWDVYRMYIQNKDLNINKVFNSPLRNDEKPSFGLFIGESGEICFKDFNVSSGDFIKFVQLKFGLNYYEALSKIVIDFNLESDFIVKKNEKTEYKKNNITENKKREDIIADLNTYKLGKKSRNWILKDISFWNNFGIKKKTLELYNVSPVSHLFIGDKIITCSNLTYCFTENKDNVITYKIYQPFNKEYKWLNNHNSSVWQGWTQLPEKGDILIITKSLKDVMSIKDVCGIPSVSLQTESSKPKLKIILELKQRFKKIFLLYDNDFDKEINWGNTFGKELCKEFDLKQIEIDSKFKSKDFSDLVKNYKETFAKNYLIDLINKA